MLIVSNYPDTKLIRCAQCGEVGQIASYSPVSNAKVCIVCTAHFKTLSSLKEWQVYKQLKATSSIKKSAAILRSPLVDIIKIALHLSAKGFVKIDEEFEVDRAKLTPIEYLVYQQATSDRLSIKSEYLQILAEELELPIKTIRATISSLRVKKLKIPNSKTRAANLKSKIKTILEESNLNKPFLVVQLSSQFKLPCDRIEQIISEIEADGFQKSDGEFTRSLLDLLEQQNRFMSAVEIKEYFPDRSRQVIRWALERLRLKKFLIRRKGDKFVEYKVLK